MLILVLRTDRPEAELGLYDDETQLAYETWHAHRQLAETLHAKIAETLKEQGKTLIDVKAILCYKGPGSFTGLRIGLTVANALAHSLSIPVVTENSEDWRSLGITRLLKGESEQVAIPEYGAPVFTTQQKK